LLANLAAIAMGVLYSLNLDSDRQTPTDINL